MSELVAMVGTIAWSVYFGGALVMEFVWRPAQRHLPASQTGVVCRAMGRRYRFVALGALAVSGAAGAWRSVGAAPGPSLRDAAGRTVLASLACWIALVALVGFTAVAGHPALHARTPAGLADDERARARIRVAAAIRRMDRLLRTELVVATFATLLLASLPAGGLV